RSRTPDGKRMGGGFKATYSTFESLPPHAARPHLTHDPGRAVRRARAPRPPAGRAELPAPARPVAGEEPVTDIGARIACIYIDAQRLPSRYSAERGSRRRAVGASDPGPYPRSRTVGSVRVAAVAAWWPAAVRSIRSEER